MFFEYTVRVELGSSDWQSFDEAEKKVREATALGSQELSRMIFAQFEDRWLATHKNFRHKGREEGTYKTTFGEMRYKRLRLNRQGKNFFPLDQWVGIVSKDRCSPTLRTAIVRECTHRSFRKSAEGVSRATTVRVSPMSAWRVTQGEGTKLKKKLKQALPIQLPPPKVPSFTDKPLLQNLGHLNSKCPVLAVEIDATYCKNKSKLGQKHEVKLATLYTAKEPVGKSKKRWRLINKTVLTQRKGETLTAFFGRLAWVASSVYGADDHTLFILRGDGDPWIRRLKDDHFPKAIHFLDHWHVKKKMKIAFGEFITFEILMPYIYARNPQGLLNHIQKTYLDRPEGLFPKQLIEMQKFYEYIKNNFDGLLPSGVPREIKDRHPSMFVRGSGVIERNIDLVIGERCKLKRMAWSQQGLDNLLALREYQINRANDSPLLKVLAA